MLPSDRAPSPPSVPAGGGGLESVADAPEQSRPSRARRLAVAEQGVTAIEYALIASLIAVTILAGVGALGVEVEALYRRVCNAVSDAIGIGGGSC